MRKVYTVFLVLLFAATFAPFALATHEADHRFAVTGHVYGKDGKPVPKATVAVKNRGGQILGTGKTTSSGFYKVKLHLHDSDFGQRLIVKSGESEKEFRVEFKRGDTESERGAVVDLGVVPEGVSNKGGAGGDNLMYYGLAAVVLAGAGAILAVTRGKGKQSESKGKGGKKGKKKKKE